MSNFKLTRGLRPQHNLGERLPSGGGWRVLADLPGALAVAVALNFVILVFLRDHSTNYGYWTLNQKWKLLLVQQEAVDWLILGDSSCSQGVAPAIFEQEWGETALNLCTIGNVGVLGDLWMLEAYIERVGPPRQVVVVHVYDVWHRQINPVIFGQVQVPLRFWQDLRLADELLAAKTVRDEMFLERYVPVQSQRRTLANMLKGALLLRDNLLTPLWVMQPDGFVPATTPHPERVLEDVENHLLFVSQNTFSISEINRRALSEMVDLAERHGFTIYLVNSPVYAGLYTDDEFRAYLTAKLAWQMDFAAQSNAVRVIQAVRTFPAEQMQNQDHLVVGAAEVYTYWLLGELAWLRP